MIIVDTNAVFHFFASKKQEGQDMKNVYELDKHWIVPYLFWYELLNVFCSQIKYASMTLERAQELYEMVRVFFYDRVYSSNPQKVLNIAVESECSVYDCEFVAIAIDFGIPLITYDKKILKTFSNIAMTADTFIQKGKDL